MTDNRQRASGLIGGLVLLAMTAAGLACIGVVAVMLAPADRWPTLTAWLDEPALRPPPVDPPPTAVPLPTTSTSVPELPLDHATGGVRLAFREAAPPSWDTCDARACTTEIRVETPSDPLPAPVQAALDRLRARAEQGAAVWAADAVPLELRPLTDALLLVTGPARCCDADAPLLRVTVDGRLVFDVLPVASRGDAVADEAGRGP